MTGWPVWTCERSAALNPTTALRVPILLSLIVVAAVLTVAALQDPGEPGSTVPRWDARGSGTLPWQGVSSLDVREDRAVLGYVNTGKILAIYLQIDSHRAP